jgi:phosphoenolpyruvate carboxykinase (GTP)
MYVLPFSMGPIGSPDLADRRRAHRLALRRRQHAHHDAHRASRCSTRSATARVVPCMHSVGAPLAPGPAGRAVAVQPGEKYIVHFPETREIWSYGSGYGGNALLGKKCFALRIASLHGARRGLDGRAHADPRRRESRRARRPTSPPPSPAPAARPTSPCSSRPLPLPGWKVWTVGDDIAWIKPGRDGRLYADQPRGRLLRRRPRHLDEDETRTRWRLARTPSSPTSRSRRRRRLVGGHDRGAAAAAARLAGQPWTPIGKRRRPRTRTPASPRRRAVPDDRPGWEDPKGVPISAIIFGGRRATTMPLVYQAFNWSTASTSAPRWARRPPPPPPARSARCAATRWRCCPSAATTWATTSATGSRCSAKRSARRRASST